MTHDDLVKRAVPKEYRVGDTWCGHLWEAMLIFGEFCRMGPEAPFETSIIIEKAVAEEEGK